MSWYHIASPSYWKWDTTKERLAFKKNRFYLFIFLVVIFFSSGGWFVIKIISKRWLKQHTWQDFSLAPMLLAAYLIIWDEGSLFSSVSPSWWVHRAMTTWLLVSQSIIKKKEIIYAYPNFRPYVAPSLQLQTASLFSPCSESVREPLPLVVYSPASFTAWSCQLRQIGLLQGLSATSSWLWVTPF